MLRCIHFSLLLWKHVSTIADTQTDGGEMGYNKRLRRTVLVYICVLCTRVCVSEGFVTHDWLSWNNGPIGATVFSL